MCRRERENDLEAKEGMRRKEWKRLIRANGDESVKREENRLVAQTWTRRKHFVEEVDGEHATSI